MNRFCFILEYDGTDFFGWQDAGALPSIESALKESFHRILKVSPLLSAASRTDSGVHAKGQVVKVEDPLELTEDIRKTFFRINATLPRSIRIPRAGIVKSTFHPTLQNSGKIYKYHFYTASEQPPFLQPYSWHIPNRTWDFELLKEAIPHLIGKRDFSALCNQRLDLPEDRVRTLHDIAFEQKGEHHYVLTFWGDAFLYKMARNLSGTLIDIASQRLTLDALQKGLTFKDRRLLGVTAPAHGLFLERVLYDEDPFLEIHSI